MTSSCSLFLFPGGILPLAASKRAVVKGGFAHARLGEGGAEQYSPIARPVQQQAAELEGWAGAPELRIASSPLSWADADCRSRRLDDSGRRLGGQARRHPRDGAGGIMGARPSAPRIRPRPAAALGTACRLSPSPEMAARD